MKKYKNTLQEGSVRYIVFKESDTWYAVALEFNIVESGDDPREALLLLFEAMQGYVNSASKIKARPMILNQKPDAEYEQMWNKLQQHKQDYASQDLPPIYTFGTQQLGSYRYV